MLVTGDNTEEMIRELEEDPRVVYAEPNYIMEPMMFRQTRAMNISGDLKIH